jgi:outer membrane protein assembly factor BamB
VEQDISDMGSRTPAHPTVGVFSAIPTWVPNQELRITNVPIPMPQSTLGDLGFSVQITGPSEFPSTLLVMPFHADHSEGIDLLSVRVFRWQEDASGWSPVWNSGINTSDHFAWAKIHRPGVYVPIGLPRDPLLLDMLARLARDRRYAADQSTEDHQILTRKALEVFLEVPLNHLQLVRQAHSHVTRQIEEQVSLSSEVRRGRGGVMLPIPLPRNAALVEFGERVKRLETLREGLPEEMLFFPPDAIDPVYPGISARLTQIVPADLLDPLRKVLPLGPLCLLFANDWWMYHGNEQHDGNATGCSNLRSTTVHRLVSVHQVNVPGRVFSIPTIVDGTIYVGTQTDASGGTLYKIDLVSGAVEGTFPFPIPSAGPPGQWGSGTGGSPAVVEGNIYLSSLDGKIYCVDANTMTQHWVTDLRYASIAQQAIPPYHLFLIHNQPLTQPTAASWTSPLVVTTRSGRRKVYVGSGLGEYDGPNPITPNVFGFIYCLDADTGHVLWLFCTNKFTSGADNAPNVIPASTWKTGLASSPPGGFSIHADPQDSNGTAQWGASVWSSCAYDAASNRIFVGTGNPQPDGPVDHNWPYSSGVLALDADTGTFVGFFQPSLSDCYRPNDTDIDIPSSPMLFTRGGTRMLAIGSKMGSFFLLDPQSTPALALLARRQLLPYVNNDPANPLPHIDAHTDPDENMWGIFGTAAVHAGTGKLFVGLGGHSFDIHIRGSDFTVIPIDTPTTPFIRTLDWNTLDPGWPITVGGDGVTRYNIPFQPMYHNPGELALSSPAVVNDVVFVTTNRPALYAFDVETGVCLWSASDLNTPPSGSPARDVVNIGAAIFGNYVVLGTSEGVVHIYSLAPIWHIPIPQHGPRPVPPGDPVEQIVKGVIQVMRQIRQEER